MYTSPSEWTISKYSIPFEIIPIDSLPLQRTSERHIFTSTHMNTFTFQKLPQMPVGLFSWTEYSHLILCIYYSFPQKSSVILSPRQNLLWINNWQLKWPLGGCSAPHQVALPVLEHAETCPGLPGHWTTRVGWVWMEALPPVPILVSLKSYKNTDYCKSDCQIGN